MAIAARIVWWMAAFCFIAGPRFKVLDLHIAAVAFLFAVGAYQMTSARVSRASVVCLVLWSAAAAYGVVISALHGFVDLEFAYIAAKACMYTVAGIGLFALRPSRSRETRPDQVVQAVFVVTVISALGVIAVSMSSVVRNEFAALLYLPEKEEWVASGRRAFDICIGGGAAGSAVFSAVWIGTLPYVRARLSPFRIIGSASIALAFILMGRTGLVAAAVLLACGITAGLIRRVLVGPIRVGRLKRRGMLAVMYGGGLAIIAWALAVGTPTGQRIVGHYSSTVVPWAFEFLFEYQRTGRLATKSTDAVMSMYFVPDTASTLVFGNSNAGRGENLPYIRSDVGFVRTIYAAGIVGTVLMFLPYAYLGWKAFERRTTRHGFALGVMVAVTILVNFKEWHVAPRGGAAVLGLLTAALASVAVQRPHGAPGSNDSDVPTRQPAVIT